jgi:single-strand DNA-binding protein
MNLCTFSGRLGQNPATHSSSNGAVTTFSIAVKDSGAKKDTPPMWLNVVTFGKLAEIVQKYLSKGRECIVVGRVTMEEYESKGQKKTSMKLYANSVEFIGGQKESNSGSTNEPENQEEVF